MKFTVHNRNEFIGKANPDEASEKRFIYDPKSSKATTKVMITLIPWAIKKAYMGLLLCVSGSKPISVKSSAPRTANPCMLF
jgi:hypothetical protein